MNKNVRHILTIDVEDWPQSTLDFSLPVTERAVRNTRLLLDVLRRYEVRGTFFVLGLMAERFPDLVAEIARDGHEIASHGYSHKPVYGLTPAAFEDELLRSMRLLEEISGQQVVGYRAPDFSINTEALWALDVLAANGLRYDSSIFPVRTARYGINSAARHLHRLDNGLLELPLSTLEWAGRRWPIAGGGYLRLYPYHLTHWAIDRIADEGHPVVVYLHPYELDPRELDEIIWPIPRRLRITQGLNRSRTRGKLERLLQSFNFGPAREVVDLHVAANERAALIEAPGYQVSSGG